jgi:hypothetical protein
MMIRERSSDSDPFLLLLDWVTKEGTEVAERVWGGWVTERDWGIVSWGSYRVPSERRSFRLC